MNYTTLEKLHTRFWSRVEKTEGCWNWAGAIHKSGYGYISFRKKNLRAHRISWELHNNGIIPDGYHVHHICQNKKCVNPSHLELLSPYDHWEITLSSIHDKKESRTHCKYGHALTEATSFVYTNPTTGYSSRRCRICKNTAERQRKRKSGSS